MKQFSFSYRERLHLQKDFKKVFKSGCRLENRKIKILAYKNDGLYLRRLGLVTSRKVGIAAVRNRTKRRLREIFRTHKHLLEPGLDLVFISKPETASLDYNILKKTVLELLESAGLYKDKTKNTGTL
ncbi:MAG: ribonuclease P protein component [Endomicrobia bacterium]|nr:ribonuclease P protein component [Endomicrobiia bacterium]MCL2799827.1 ribonuclease P protein component [Endomicrobiia bacterium]